MKYIDYTRLPSESDIKVDAKSPLTPPASRSLGYAGKKALKNFLREMGINEGAH